MIVVSYSLKNFVNTYNYKKINIDNIKAGMILSLETSVVIASKQKTFKKISDETLKSRLNKEDVELLKRIDFEKIGINDIVVVRKIPFASFIAFSTIFVIVFWSVIWK